MFIAQPLCQESVPYNTTILLYHTSPLLLTTVGPWWQLKLTLINWPPLSASLRVSIRTEEPHQPCINDLLLELLWPHVDLLIQLYFFGSISRLFGSLVSFMPKTNTQVHGQIYKKKMITKSENKTKELWMLFPITICVRKQGHQGFFSKWSNLTKPCLSSFCRKKDSHCVAICQWSRFF